MASPGGILQIGSTGRGSDASGLREDREEQCGTTRAVLRAS
jgi:hypothetical protein